MSISTSEYARLALQIVATDRALAKQLAAALAKQKPVRRQLVLLEAAVRDALAETNVSAEAQEAHRLVRQARRPRG